MPPDATLIAVFLAVMYALLVLAAVFLIPYIFYLITLHRALAAVSPKNRMMAPGLVWLNLIPVFSLGWSFYIVFQITESYKREFAERGLNTGADFGFGVGIAMCIVGVCRVIPFLGFFCALATFICWIIYWIKVAELRRAIT